MPQGHGHRPSYGRFLAWVDPRLRMDVGEVLSIYRLNVLRCLCVRRSVGPVVKEGALLISFSLTKGGGGRRSLSTLPYLPCRG